MNSDSATMLVRAYNHTMSTFRQIVRWYLSLVLRVRSETKHKVNVKQYPLF